MENEIEKAIEYKKMRDLCAGEFSMYCGGRKCPYFETETCESNRNKTFQESDFNNLAISALEKQVPKSVSFDINNHNNVYCHCGKNVRDLKDFYDNNYCIKCGQLLKWSDNDK